MNHGYTTLIPFDLEAIPNESAIVTPAWIEYKEKNNLKDEDAALHPAFAQIVSIAAMKRGTKESIACASNSEFDLCGLLSDFVGDDPLIAMGGHNILGFDIPLFVSRCLALGVKVPACMKLYGVKPWEVKHIDTMEVMKCGKGRGISLDAMCLILGVPSPKDGEVKGNCVWDAYKAGKLDEICAYNKRDVNAWIKCLLKLEKAGIL